MSFLQLLCLDCRAIYIKASAYHVTKFSFLVYRGRKFLCLHEHAHRRQGLNKVLIGKRLVEFLVESNVRWTLIIGIFMESLGLFRVSHTFKTQPAAPRSHPCMN